MSDLGEVSVGRRGSFGDARGAIFRVVGVGISYAAFNAADHSPP
jgi:hypothetical protein